MLVGEPALRRRAAKGEVLGLIIDESVGLAIRVVDPAPVWWTDGIATL
jgi:hypothetical protein